MLQRTVNQPKKIKKNPENRTDRQQKKEMLLAILLKYTKK